jgi:hypothetical protein
MSNLLLIILIVAAILLIYAINATMQYLKLEKEKRIRNYKFPTEIFPRVQKQYPHLEDKDADLVASALRQYFIVYLLSDKETVGMPSKVVDAMWHEFILDTRKYSAFCKMAFGGYFHHLPASTSENGMAIENSIKRTLILALQDENLNPAKPSRLPLLFTIDETLNIPDGNTYRLPSLLQTSETSDDSTPSICGGRSCSGGEGGGDGGDGGGGGCGGGGGGGCGGGGGGD